MQANKEHKKIQASRFTKFDSLFFGKPHLYTMCLFIQLKIKLCGLKYCNWTVDYKGSHSRRHEINFDHLCSFKAQPKHGTQAFLHSAFIRMQLRPRMEPVTYCSAVQCHCHWGCALCACSLGISDLKILCKWQVTFYVNYCSNEVLLEMEQI